MSKHEFDPFGRGLHKHVRGTRQKLIAGLAVLASLGAAGAAVTSSISGRKTAERIYVKGTETSVTPSAGVPHYAGALFVYTAGARRPSLMVADPIALPRDGYAHPDPSNPKDWNYYYTSEGSSDTVPPQVVLAGFPAGLREELARIPGQSGRVETTKLKSFDIVNPHTGGQDYASFAQEFPNVRRLLPLSFLAHNNVANSPEWVGNQVSAEVSILTPVVYYPASEHIDRFPQNMIGTPIDFTYGSYRPDLNPITANPGSG